MSQLRCDPITGRWIIADITSPKRPGEFELMPQKKKGGACPFCAGSEKMTPPEISAIRKPGTKPDTPGWSVRTVPNKFPALDTQGSVENRAIGIYDMSSGIGAHEVIIETPAHDKDLADLTPKEIENVISEYRARSLVLEKDDRFRYLLIFKNHGAAAGASLEHSHTQIVALPIVPKRVKEELKGAVTYFGYRERCVFCDMVAQELQDKLRVIFENRHFVAFCPFVPRFAFETWIVPKKHNQDFKSIDDKTVKSMAAILKDTLARIKKVLKDPAYNFIIHTAPIRDGINEEFHWHLEIMPKLTSVAGFEWGSGFYINPTSPEFAAKCLRQGKGE
ncbi:MAG: galactose-1-phosphate uridylyltransferase [Candidatus Omnitrophica bacterium]|nr:galactose-1-phosphate uridylyltransferase [Candidatus Omnitrophota bacterium]